MRTDGTVAAALEWARSMLGMGEPNKVQTWYNTTISNLGNGNWAWCAAFVSYVMYHCGARAAIKVARAYTVYFAQDFKAAGTWKAGTDANVRLAKPGDVVFFDWGGTDSIGNIDHVGIVEVNLGGGRVQTIEGNTSDACRRRVRSASAIAGFGRPKYQAVIKPLPMPVAWKWDGKAPKGAVVLETGSKGNSVKALQSALNKVQTTPDLKVDGEFGPATDKALKAFQAKAKLTVDGQYGLKTAAKLTAALTPLIPIPPVVLPPPVVTPPPPVDDPPPVVTPPVGDSTVDTSWLSARWKGVIATVAAIAIVVTQVIQAQSADGSWTFSDTLVTALALFGAVGVYFKANK